MPMPRRLTANKSPVPARPSSPNYLISSSRSRLERRPHLLLLLAGLWLLQLAASRGVQAFPSPLSDAMTSHSGPTNALWGHEKLVPEEEMRKRTKRQVYFGGYGGWRSPALMSAAAPDGYQQMWITSEHNRYRRMVPATNMRMIYWSEELARSAQAHANTCDFRHSRNRVNIGENIWAAPYYNYSDAIYRWYSEVNNPWCGCSTGYKHCCGHYIQLVWAQTNLIGCGYAQCNGVVGVGGYGRAVFVCHYNPQGNKVMYTGSGELYALQFPAYNWARAETERCSQCPPDQPACHEGLCYMPLNYQAPAVTQVANNSVTDAVATAAPTVAPYVAPYYPPAVAVQQQPAQQPATNYGQQQNYAPNNYAQQQQQQQQQSTLDTQLETNKIDRRRMMRRRMMAMYY